jgi:glycosyltransferase involved in cell wall biosynthesis
MDKKIAIAHIGCKCIPPGKESGGIDRYVLEIFRIMANRGHRILFFNWNRCEKKIIDGKYENIEIQKVYRVGRGFLRTVSSSLFATFRVVKERKKIGIVNLHAPASYVVAPIIRALGFKLVITIHDRIDLNPGYGSFGRFLLLVAFNIAMLFSDGVILGSGHLEELIKKYKGITYTIARPGIYLDNISSDDEMLFLKELGCWENSFVLYIGRLSPGKGLEYLIRSFRRIDNQKLKLIIAGSPRTPGYMNKLLNFSKGDKRISFIGHVEGLKKKALFSRAIVFALPSLSESVSIVVLEALAQGCRCIVNNIPAMHEIKKLLNLPDEIMKIIDYKDHNSFLYALNTLLKKSSIPLPFLLENNIYSWEESEKETLNLYVKVLNK